MSIYGLDFYFQVTNISKFSISNISFIAGIKLDPWEIVDSLNSNDELEIAYFYIEMYYNLPNTELSLSNV